MRGCCALVRPGLWLATLAMLGTAATAVAERNYLIITAQDYANSTPLNQFIAHRQATGFRVMTYVPTSGQTNTSIKNYVLSLWGTQDQPAYILVVGDTSGTTATNSTVPHFTGSGSKSAATDWPYGCMPGSIDWYPDIPVGRFSVASVASLGDVVTKTLWLEAGNFPNPDFYRRGAFLANADTQGTSEPTHDLVIQKYFEPRDYEGVKIYASQGGNTAQVTAAVNTGCLWTVYFGHSGSSGWWSPAFSQSNVSALTNTGLYGLAFGFSCNTADFTLGECFGETWLRAPMKGAAAYISASNYIYWGSWDAWQPSVHLEKAFFKSFFENDEWEIGAAWMTGLYEFLTTYGGWDGDPNHLPPNHLDECHNFFEEFVILGDPALTLPHGNSFRMLAAPASVAVCAPQDAVYTIDVQPAGDFTEAVTLSVPNAPLGATIAFSANTAVPPFTSVLTVGGTGSVNPGTYSLTIQGVSASVTRNVAVGLYVASAVPSQPTLTSPAAGATDVPLRPQLVWAPVGGAMEYEVEVATDAGFANIVETATTTQTNHTVVNALGSLTRYYWHVRATNGCGAGAFAAAWSFKTVGMVMPVSYDMLNGETGTYTYYDDTYNGSGNPQQALSPLSGGLGDLTDGVIATQNWNTANVPWVGWHTVMPTITFHFAEDMRIHTVVLHVDDSNGAGGVYPPSLVRLTMGGQTLQYTPVDPPGGQPFALTYSGLNLQGNALEVYLGRSGSNYLMLSEVEFFGGPLHPPGDCDLDGDIDIADFNVLAGCMAGPGVAHLPSCAPADLDSDDDVDLADLAEFQLLFGQ